MLEFIILGVLCRESLTGYDIRKRIEQGIGMFYKASYGSIYPILARIQGKGLVESEESMAGRKKSICYTVTEEGKRVFMEWLSEPVERGITMEAFMAKVFFFDRLPKEQASAQIAAYEKELHDYREQLLLQREQYSKLKGQEHFYHKLSTLYYGICKLQSMIEWCEVVRQRKELEGLV